MAVLEQEQWRRKAFVDRHRHGNETDFGIGRPVLVFQSRMDIISGKLWFQWTRPFWITREFNGSYQLGTLSDEILNKWANSF